VVPAERRASLDLIKRPGRFTKPKAACRKDHLARVGRIDRSIEESPCALRCRRTEARKLKYNGT